MSDIDHYRLYSWWLNSRCRSSGRYQSLCRVLEVSEASVHEQRHYPKAGRPARKALPQRVSYHLQGVLLARTSLLTERLERA